MVSLSLLNIETSFQHNHGVRRQRRCFLVNLQPSKEGWLYQGEESVVSLHPGGEGAQSAARHEDSAQRHEGKTQSSR